MLEITKSAIEKISEYFKDKPLKPVRILLHGGGWQSVIVMFS
ncbi:MAG: hypothetical protein ACWGNI_10325 [Desulfobacterales bacterium]